MSDGVWLYLFSDGGEVRYGLYNVFMYDYYYFTRIALVLCSVSTESLSALQLSMYTNIFSGKEEYT
jgi:hypothetical protein